MPVCDAEFAVMEAAYTVTLQTQTAVNQASAALSLAEAQNDAAFAALQVASDLYDTCMNGGGVELTAPGAERKIPLRALQAMAALREYREARGY